MTSQTPPRQPIPRDQMRVSDHDRELVANVLQTGYAEGRITREEFDERLSSAMSSKTFGDLTPLTADLTPRAAHEQYRSPAVPSQGRALVQTENASPVIDSDMVIMSSKKRNERLRLKKKTATTVLLGDIVYDLREDGVLESMDCEIAINVIMGDFKIYVPAGVNVIDRVNNIMGDTKIKGLDPAEHDAPTITLTGLCMLGDVKVLGPNHVSFGEKLGITKSKKKNAAG